jgi:hypothetical protein
MLDVVVRGRGAAHPPNKALLLLPTELGPHGVGRVHTGNRPAREAHECDHIVACLLCRSVVVSREGFRQGEHHRCYPTCAIAHCQPEARKLHMHYHKIHGKSMPFVIATLTYPLGGKWSKLTSLVGFKVEFSSSVTVLWIGPQRGNGKGQLGVVPITQSARTIHIVGFGTQLGNSGYTFHTQTRVMT